MSLEGQRLQPDRYTVVPRTLCFLLYQDQILLLKLAEERGPWGGKYNGVGGHIERGEDPTSAARREIFEEAGLSPTSIRLCGVIFIDTNQNTGISLFVFLGQVDGISDIQTCEEGSLHWVKQAELNRLPLVEDLLIILPKALEAYESGIPFSAKYKYKKNGEVLIKFGE